MAKKSGGRGKGFMKSGTKQTRSKSGLPASRRSTQRSTAKRKSLGGALSVDQVKTRDRDTAKRGGGRPGQRDPIPE